MRAMVVTRPGAPLELRNLPVPFCGPAHVLLRVKACGVCRTDLHVADGDLAVCRYPVVPGHEAVGVIEEVGREVRDLARGMRVGVPWLGRSCGTCAYCLADRENLCETPGFTGCTLDGGYAEYLAADARYCFPAPEGYGDAEAAPLYCAGLIGYRALRMAGDARILGIYGFGAAAHLITQVAVHQGRKVMAFTRPGDAAAREFARSLGAAWAGDSTASPPERLEAALIFAPVGPLVIEALKALDKGGIVICAGIHMSDIPSFPYRLLWEERVIRSVANLTRQDATGFLEIAPKVPVRTHVTTYALEKANDALADLREGRLKGAAVLVP